MIVHSYVAEDPRVRREAEALVAAGRPVTVIGLRPPDGPPRVDLGGIDLHQLDVQRHQGAGLGTYLREYLAFLCRSMVAAVRLHRRRRFALVQVHSLPDFLVFAALPLRLVGGPVLLDLHEAMPEFFRSRFPRAANRFVPPAARPPGAPVDRRRHAHDHGQRRDARPPHRPRRRTRAHCRVVINSPSLARFDITAASPPAVPPRRTPAAASTPAPLTPTYELDVAVRAIARIATERPDLDVILDVYGRGDFEDALRELAAELGVTDRVVFHGRIPIDDVPAQVARSDIGLAPTRHDPFTDMSLSTKVFEYAAMGKPVVASALPMVERTFPNGTVAAYRPGDADAMAAAILAFADDQARARGGRRAHRGDRRGECLGAGVARLPRARRPTHRDRVVPYRRPYPAPAFAGPHRPLP